MTYSPRDSEHSVGRIYILYTGQHYDALLGDDNRTIFRNEDCDSTDTLAIACASQHKAAWDEKMRTRTRKRIKCSGCQAVLATATEFQEHCMSVEHDDDFCFECEDIEVTELVESPNDD